MRAAVIVLGDLGRSPRMQRHALMLAHERHDVHLIGYEGRALFEQVQQEGRIRVATIPEFGVLRRTALLAPLRQVALAVSLLARLVRLGRFDLFFVQNPPALPTLLVTGLVSAVWRAPVVLDWHSLTHAQARFRYRPATPLIAFLEKRLSASAAAHLAVTTRLAEHVQQWLRIPKVHALYDLPLRHPPRPEKEPPVPGRPVTIMTGTSFTDDEDLEMIGRVATRLDPLAAAGRIPPVHLLVAGEGDRRAELEGAWRALSLEHVTFEFGWFRQGEYQRRVREATLMLSLHASTTKLDLPTKISDAVGAGTPILLFDYDPSLRQAISEPAACFFKDEEELVTCIVGILEDLPRNDRLQRMRAAIAAADKDCWEDAWLRVVPPILGGLMRE